MDAVTWAKTGLIDQLVVTPFWASIETDMPIEKWKELLGNSPVVLAAGLELLLRPYPEASSGFTNDAQTIFGAAASLLYRGADHIYLFNYMDSETTVGSPDELNLILCNAGDMRTITVHPRRHVVTYSDTWAPEEPATYALPALCDNEGSAEIKIHIGPRPEKGKAIVFIGLGKKGNPDAELLSIRVNDHSCEKTKSPPPSHVHPVVKAMAGFDVPLTALKNGYNHIEISSSTKVPHKIVWVEMDIIP
jgi:hypothetical protein